MKGLIVLNGKIEDLIRLREIGIRSDFILSADGGTDYCFKAGLIPNVVIGDLDSISEESLKKIKEENIPIVKFPTKKDKTDSELSIDYLVEMGIMDITLVGAIGSRMDHTLANIFLLNKMIEKGIKMKIIDNYNIIYLVDDELIIPNSEGSFVSIIPVDSSGIVVSLKGFEYELDKVKIEFSSTHGISNRVTELEGYIKVHKGKCYVIISKD